MENETGTQERAGSDGSKEGGVIRLKDDDGTWVVSGDQVEFSYGIPPRQVVADVEEFRGNLTIITPKGHTPRLCLLRSLRHHVGSWYKYQG